ncbi:hypothetical protein [Novosphingobium sp. THN1]|uniref:hypothetical protein n=1 Tax=Novosphingobium sp. THN1 TaxID=1016987 RepID=UPI001967AB61|nr:hypothetical protein [Novosphingobium sp. THN1]
MGFVVAARKSLVHPVLFSNHFGLSANALNSAKLLDPILNSDTKLFIDPLLLSKSQNTVIKKEGRKAVQASFENVIGLLDISATEGMSHGRGPTKR